MRLVVVAATGIVLIVASAATAGPAWDLTKCRESFTEAKANAGHVCTSEHLEADFQQLVRLCTIDVADERRPSGRNTVGGDDPFAEALAQALADYDRKRKTLEGPVESGVLEELLQVAAKTTTGRPEFEPATTRSHAERSTLPSRSPSAQPENAVSIHHGFYTGEEVLRLSEVQQSSYASGLIDGMFLAPLFGAPKRLSFRPKEMPATTRAEWLENCVVGMSNEQVAAIIRKFLSDHPERWHESAHRLLYSALVSSCPGPIPLQ